MVGDFLFRAKYFLPKVSATTTNKITTSDDPEQIYLDGNDIIKAHREKNIYALKLQAKYSISGLVVAKNNNFWFRDIMRNQFDDIALLDLGIVWGDLAVDKKVLYKHIKFKSIKTLEQARQLEYNWKGVTPWDQYYISYHLSHTHIIPANANVMSALMKIKKNDIVKLDGYLVDIYNSKGDIVGLTSMSRTDTNATSRGANRGGGM